VYASCAAWAARTYGNARTAHRCRYWRGASGLERRLGWRCRIRWPIGRGCARTARPASRKYTIGQGHARDIAIRGNANRRATRRIQAFDRRAIFAQNHTTLIVDSEAAEGEENKEGEFVVQRGI
jgi:hypothetical protein